MLRLVDVCKATLNRLEVRTMNWRYVQYWMARIEEEMAAGEDTEGR